MGEPLTDEQIAQEEEFLKGIPRINIGALLMPPIWGPAHGFWICILFYPAWLFADNCFYSAVTMPKPSTIIIAIIVFVILLAVTVVFSIISQPLAAHRAAERGKTKEEYLRAQKRWAIGCAIGGVAMIVLATIYNLYIRVPLS